MAVVSVTKEINASAQSVWELMGGFDTLPQWLPGVVQSVSQEGGRARALTTASGETIVERLETFDNFRRSYSYSIVQAPLPVTDYHSTLSVYETTDNNISCVEWSCQFTPVDISDSQAVAIFAGIYEDGLNALKDKFLL